MKVKLSLEKVPQPLRKHTRFILYSVTFGGLNLSDICRKGNVQRRNFYRLFTGELSDRKATEMVDALMGVIPLSLDKEYLNLVEATMLDAEKLYTIQGGDIY